MPPPLRRNPFGVGLSTIPQERWHRLKPHQYAERLDLLMPYRPDLGAGLKFADLFSGIGGFHLALSSRLGMTCELACEIKANPRNVYLRNFGIQPDRFPKNIIEYVRNFREDLTFDIVCAGFPCQPWSKAGLGEGYQDSKGRGGPVITAMHAFIEHYRPGAFILENVDEFGKPKKIKWTKDLYDTVFNGFARSFTDIGYVVMAKIYQSEDFGLPQPRKRVFIIGFDKSRLDGFPIFRFPAQLPEKHPGRIAFHEIVSGIPHRLAKDRDKRFHSEMPAAWTLRAAGEGGHGKDWTPKQKYRHDKNCDFYRIVVDHWSAPDGDGIEREDAKVSGAHKIEYRQLHTSERLRLLGFPDGFLDGTFGEKELSGNARHRLAGNSISIPTLYHLALPVIRQIRALKPRVARP